MPEPVELSAFAKQIIVSVVLLVVVSVVLVKASVALHAWSKRAMRKPGVKVAMAVAVAVTSRTQKAWRQLTRHLGALAAMRRLKRSGGFLDLDDPRFARTPEEEAKGTLFYVVGCWARPPWEPEWRLYAYKFGITGNKPARMNQLNTATFTKNIVVCELPLGAAFEDLILASTIQWRTDGAGQELRWAVPEVRRMVERLTQWSKASQTTGYMAELGGMR